MKKLLCILSIFGLLFSGAAMAKADSKNSNIAILGTAAPVYMTDEELNDVKGELFPVLIPIGIAVTTCLTSLCSAVVRQAVNKLVQLGLTEVDDIIIADYIASQNNCGRRYC